MRRTPQQKEFQVLDLAIQGYTQPQISMATSIPVSTIKKIMKRHREHFEAEKAHLDKWSAEKAAESLQRAYSLLDRYMERAEKGEVKMSIKQLIMVADMGYLHAEISKVIDGYAPLNEKRKNIETLMSKLKIAKVRRKRD